MKPLDRVGVDRHFPLPFLHIWNRRDRPWRFIEKSRPLLLAGTARP